ncbi:MAG: antitoxin, RHH family protein [Elusimicrobiota bacterium]
MPTKNPRLQVMLEGPLYEAVAALAGEDGVSMSTKARDLIREALERLEDVTLEKIVEERAARSAKPLTLKGMEKRLGR